MKEKEVEECKVIFKCRWIYWNDIKTKQQTS